jgi:hypothetical protein
MRAFARESVCVGRVAGHSRSLGLLCLVVVSAVLIGHCAAAASPSAFTLAGGFAGTATLLPKSIRLHDGEVLTVTGVAQHRDGVTFTAGASSVAIHCETRGDSTIRDATAAFWNRDFVQLQSTFETLAAGSILDVTPKFHRREARLSIEPRCSDGGFCSSPKHQIVHLYKSNVGALGIIILSEGFVQVVADSLESGGDPKVRIEKGPSRPIVSSKVGLCGQSAFFFIENAVDAPGDLATEDLRRVARRSAEIIAQVLDALRGACT